MFVKSEMQLTDIAADHQSIGKRMSPPVMLFECMRTYEKPFFPVAVCTLIASELA